LDPPLLDPLLYFCSYLFNDFKFFNLLWSHDSEFDHLNNAFASLRTSLPLSKHRFDNHLSNVESLSVQPARPEAVPYSIVNDELQDSDFPPLPPPSQSMTSITATRPGIASNYQHRPTNDRIHLKRDLFGRQFNADSDTSV